GLLRLGVLPVFALPPHREHEIGYLAEHAEAVAYLACDSFGGFAYGELGVAARKASPALRHVLLLDGADDERSGASPASPEAHNFPLGCPGLMGTLAAGGRVVMAPSPKPEDAMAAVEAEGVTVTALVPALAIRWLEANQERRFDLSSLRVLQVGGARLVPEVA